jgi:hypothetical protein
MTAFKITDPEYLHKNIQWVYIKSVSRLGKDLHPLKKFVMKIACGCVQPYMRMAAPRYYSGIHMVSDQEMDTQVVGV